MKCLVLAVVSVGLLSAAGCCSCLHNAAAWRKGVAAPHVCGDGHGFGCAGCCPCGNNCGGGCCNSGCDGGRHGNCGRGPRFRFPFSLSGGCGHHCGMSDCLSCKGCGGGCNGGSGCGGGIFGGHGGCGGGFNAWPTDGGVDRCDPCCDDGCWDHGRCDSCGTPCDEDCDRWLADDDRGYYGGNAGCFGCGGCDGCGGGCGDGPRRWRGWNLGWLNPYNWHGGCRACGCGASYWHEWISDPPCCHDPCDCCGNWQGQTCGNGPYCGHCASAGGAGPQYGPYYSGRAQPGKTAPTLAKQPANASGEIENYVMRKPPAAPRTATRNRSALPQPRPAAKTPAGARRPTPAAPQAAVEEKVVEGSLKVVDDRAVEPTSAAATAERSPTPAQRSAPRTAKRRPQAPSFTARREPTT